MTCRHIQNWSDADKERSEAFSCVLYHYRRYMLHENALSYIQGRDYNLLYAGLYVSALVLDANTQTECTDALSKVHKYGEAVDAFIADAKKNYPGIVDYLEASNFYKTWDSNKEKQINKIPNKVLNQHAFFLYRFFKLYGQSQRHFNASKLDVLLIEFNNYLSHLVAYVADSHSSDGIGHINRAILDAYKEFIAVNMVKILAQKELTQSYILLRCLESEEVGKSIIDNKNRDKILESYQTIYAAIGG